MPAGCDSFGPEDLDALEMFSGVGNVARSFGALVALALAYVCVCVCARGACLASELKKIL